jgi:hypothetical protein
MARSIDLLSQSELPMELVLESSLPDEATDRRLAAPQPKWLRGLTDFEVEGGFDFGEYQADLILSTSGLSR